MLLHQRNAHLTQGVLAPRLPPEGCSQGLAGCCSLEGPCCLCEARCRVQGGCVGQGPRRRHSGSSSSGDTCACSTKAPGQAPSEAAEAHGGWPVLLLRLLLLLCLLRASSSCSKGRVEAVAGVLGAFETPGLLLGWPPRPPPLTTGCCAAASVAAGAAASVAVAGVPAVCGAGGAAAAKAVVLCCFVICVVS